ncbi:MAG: glycosyl hydrolase family 18 protein [Weeksellaceae bacterium]
MRFGFHAYHEALRDRFSSSKRVYFVVLSSFITAILAIGVLSSVSFRGLASTNDTVEPVSANYTAPYAADSRHKDRKYVVGFLPHWSIGQKAKVYPEYLDEIIYFGIWLNDDGTLRKKNDQGKTLTEWNYLSTEEFAQLKAQTKNTNTKLSVSITNFSNESIDELISNKAARQRAINDIDKLITDNDFQGINFDFEYFGGNEFTTTLPNLNVFLQESVKELKARHPGLIVSMDLNASVVYADNSYDMVKIGEIVDYIMIMAYDYRVPTSTHAGAVAPMQADGANITKTVESLMGRVPPEKIILGIPFYGYEWQTETEEYGSKVIPHTGATATYARVRDLIAARDDVKVTYDETTKSPWLTYKQNGLIKQIYYEDERSLYEKMAFVHERNLKGLGIWALGYEGSYVEPWQLIMTHLRTK